MSLPIFALALLALTTDDSPSTPSAQKCPSVDAVRNFVLDERVLAAEFEMEDQGDHFAVRANGETRRLEEPTRDCEARAKMAAVALTAMVAPPAATDRPAPPQPPKDPPAPELTRTEPPRHLCLGLGFTTELAPGAAERATFVQAGLAARVSWFSGAFGGSVGLALFAPSSFGLATTSAKMTRGTVDLSAHAEATAGAFTLRGALGFAVDVHDIRGEAADGQGELRALAGVRTGIEGAAALSSQVGLGLELAATLLPSPGDLLLHSVGKVGTEPLLYVGPTLKLWFFP